MKPASDLLALYGEAGRWPIKWTPGANTIERCGDVARVDPSDPRMMSHRTFRRLHILMILQHTELVVHLNKLQARMRQRERRARSR